MRGGELKIQEKRASERKRKEERKLGKGEEV